MIDSSAAYKQYVVADSRRTFAKAVVYLVDPDIEYSTETDSGRTALSAPLQLIDRNYEMGTPYATLECNRWTLDGSQVIAEALGEVGVELSTLSDSGCGISGSKWIELPFSGVGVLQAVELYFSDRNCDGWPTMFSVDILVSGVVVHTELIKNNTERHVKIEGFSVYSPEAIKITFFEWSLPYMRPRTAEIIPGEIETWEGDQLAGIDIQQQVDYSLLTLPYSVAKIEIDNSDRRFDPRNKTGLFQMLEDRQPVELYIGVGVPDAPEYIPSGVYYQYDGGWKSTNNAMVMKWTLVDIIGLLQMRRYSVPLSLPTKLGGWIADLVSQLGTAFSGHYYVDPNYENTSVTASGAALADVTCGQVLLWLLQATALTARSDPRNGHLTIEPYRNEGNEITLDNVVSYPTMYANGDIAEITFRVNGTDYTYAGTSTSSPTTATLSNPFIANQTAAFKAAQYIVSTFGGNRIETIGRGDPTTEIGDVATVQLDKSTATTGRVFFIRNKFVNGVLQSCTTKMLQASGSSMYENRQQFTADGSFTVPTGVTQLQLVLVGKGQSGAKGEMGYYAPDYSGPEATMTTVGESGERGADGQGGKVWTGLVAVNPGTTYSITIGDDTTFASYSSANGVRYPNGYTDINSGDSFARSGVSNPATGSGDGGRGGAGGTGGMKFYRRGILINEVPPTDGSFGAQGATGSCVIYWEDPE